MTSFRQDIFYAVDDMTHAEQEALLRKAHGICEEWWFDKLDCSESYARQRVNGISFDAAMEHFVADALFRIIHRFPVIRLDRERLEVVFRSMENPVDYFLWIIVPVERAGEITGGLKEMR